MSEQALRELIAKLQEQAHEMESPYWIHEPEQPDWDYVAKAFREIADELEVALAASGPPKEVSMPEPRPNWAKQQPGAASGEQTREVPRAKAGQFDEQAVRKLACEIWNNYAKDPEWCVKRIVSVLAAGRAASGAQLGPPCTTCGRATTPTFTCNPGVERIAKEVTDEIEAEERAKKVASEQGQVELRQRIESLPRYTPNNFTSMSGYVSGDWLNREEVLALAQPNRGKK